MLHSIIRYHSQPSLSQLRVDLDPIQAQLRPHHESLSTETPPPTQTHQLTTASSPPLSSSSSFSFLSSSRAVPTSFQLSLHSPHHPALLLPTDSLRRSNNASELPSSPPTSPANSAIMDAYAVSPLTSGGGGGDDMPKPDRCELLGPFGKLSTLSPTCREARTDGVCVDLQPYLYKARWECWPYSCCYGSVIGSVPSGLLWFGKFPSPTLQLRKNKVCDGIELRQQLTRCAYRVATQVHGCFETSLWWDFGTPCEYCPLHAILWYFFD